MTDPEPKAPVENRPGLVRDASVRARAGLDQARQKANDMIAATREKGEATIGDTREKALRAAAETNRLFQEHPVAAIAAAAAVGAIIGIFVPRIAVASKASKIAGRAVKTAVGSKTARKLWSNVKEAGKAASPPAATAAPQTEGRTDARPEADGQVPSRS